MCVVSPNVTTGGASSSGLVRDSHGREIPGLGPNVSRVPQVSAAAGRPNPQTASRADASLTRESTPLASHSAHRTAADRWSEAPPIRKRLRHKQRELINPQSVLGPELRVPHRTTKSRNLTFLKSFANRFKRHLHGKSSSNTISLTCLTAHGVIFV